MQETLVQSLSQEDSLEKGIATTPEFLPGESHGQRSLAGYSPWGPRELDMTEWLTLSLFTNLIRYICKNPISEQGYILRLWLDMPQMGTHKESQLVTVSTLEMRRYGHRDGIPFQVCPDNRRQSQDPAPKPMLLTATLSCLSKNISQMNKIIKNGRMPACSVMVHQFPSSSSWLLACLFNTQIWSSYYRS